MKIEDRQYQNSRGDILDYVIARPSQESKLGKAPPIIVLMHGYTGSITSDYIQYSLPKAVEAGAIAVSFNQTGACKDQKKICTRNLTPDNGVDDTDCFFRDFKSIPEFSDAEIFLVAPSFGGYVAMKYLIKPGAIKVKHLALPAVVPDLTKSFEKKINGHFGALKAVWKLAGYTTQNILGADHEISYDLYKQNKETNIFTEVAPKLDLPITIIQGDRDPLGSIEEVKKLSAVMLNAPEVNFYTIRGAGHIFEGPYLKQMVDLMLHKAEMTFPQMRQDRKGGSSQHLHVA